MNERKKHGWPFWVALAAIALPVLYVLSFGPVCWMTARNTREPQLPDVYFPIGWSARRSAIFGPQWLNTAIKALARIGMPNGSSVYVPINLTILDGGIEKFYEIDA